jgi:CheY-like chemotaxis protein
MQLEGREIKRALIVDDDPNVRDVYAFAVEELGIEPVFEDGPLLRLEDAIGNLRNKADALVCDYHLRKKNYSAFNGDLLVAESYKQAIPGLLCTSYTDFDVTLMRHRRRYIPGLIKPDDLTPATIVSAFRRCLRESLGKFDHSRRPWRTLIRIDEVPADERFFYVVVPGWKPDTKVRVYLDDLPDNFKPLIREGKRLHAAVNVGAEREEELFFEKWEDR